MQAENILAKNISAAGRKSSYDAACKRLLANKIILAWIMNPPENRRNTITRYSIHEENIVGNVHEIPQNYDLLSAIIICLSDSEQEADGGVLKLLEVLLSPTLEATEKKQILQDDFHKLNPFVCHRRKPTTFRWWEEPCESLAINPDSQYTFV